MKTVILIIGLVLGLGSYAQDATEILQNDHWYINKIEIENEEYIRPNNSEANLLIYNFGFQAQKYTSFCYDYELTGEVNVEDQILLVTGAGTIAFPQECDLEENNDFDRLNYYFWSNREDHERDWYINPLQFDYEINGEGNNIELVFTNESGDKAYYNDASASTSVFEAMDINIYPNPAQSVINIDLPASEYQQVIFNLYDVSGKKIKSYTENWHENIQLNISDLPAGNYLLEFNLPENSSKGYVVKLIKK